MSDKTSISPTKAGERTVTLTGAEILNLTTERGDQNLHSGIPSTSREAIHQSNDDGVVSTSAEAEISAPEDLEKNQPGESKAAAANSSIEKSLKENPGAVWVDGTQKQNEGPSSFSFGSSLSPGAPVATDDVVRLDAVAIVEEDELHKEVIASMETVSAISVKKEQTCTFSFAWRMFAGIVLLVVSISAVVMTILLRGDGEETDEVSATIYNTLLQASTKIYDKEGVAPLSDETSLQFEAFQWIKEASLLEDDRSLAPWVSDDWLITNFALYILFHSTNGTGWDLGENGSVEDWLKPPELDYCTYPMQQGSIPGTRFGYVPTCDDSQQLIGLTLKNVGVSGTLPEEIGLLTNLQYLKISSNNETLAGSIPESIGYLTDLKSLDFRNNLLTGTVPTSVGKLTNLVEFDIPRNDISGSIPSELAGMTSLRRVTLERTRLTGVIPAECCKFLEDAREKFQLSANCNFVECPCCTSCVKQQRTDL